MEEAQETATLATAGALSLETKVRRVHPEWSDEQVADEQEKIAADQAAATPSAPNPIGQASPTATAALDAARGRLPNPLAPRGGTS
jgi:hypothetical protein